MGSCFSDQAVSNQVPLRPQIQQPKLSSNNKIKDKYKSLNEVQQEIINVGLENSNLIFAIDFTKSNKDSGKRTNNGRSLHDLTVFPNQYALVIQTIINTLPKYDNDNKYKMYGFGDLRTKDHSVFPMHEKGKYIYGIKNIMNAYIKTCEKFQEDPDGKAELHMAGPTSFAPIINKAIQIVEGKKYGGYHILIIIADGIINDSGETYDAIIEASKYALSIIMIGVGDGPWDQMKNFDDNLPERKFDNFQFVQFTKFLNTNNDSKIDPSVLDTFALNALMEIPEQYTYIKKNNLIKKCIPANNDNDYDDHSPIPLDDQSQVQLASFPPSAPQNPVIYHQSYQQVPMLQQPYQQVPMFQQPYQQFQQPLQVQQF